MENFPFTDAVWIEREEPQIEPNLEEDKLPLVGTELANFLNFDIDRFMNGGYRLLWEEGEDERGSHIIGWKKTEGFDLSKLYIRMIKGKILKDIVRRLRKSAEKNCKA